MTPRGSDADPPVAARLHVRDTASSGLWRIHLMDTSASRARLLNASTMSIVDKVKPAVHTVFKAAAESVMTTRTTSAFAEKGVVTPEEFVAAGDFLVQRVISNGARGRRATPARQALPAQGQADLVTRNVPCRERAAAMEQFAGKEKNLAGDDEGWVEATEARESPTRDAQKCASLRRRCRAGAAEETALEGSRCVRRVEGHSNIGDFVDVAAEEEEDEASLIPPLSRWRARRSQASIQPLE